MEKKSNVGIYIVLSILCLLVGIVIGIVVYDKFIDNDNKENNDGNTIHYKDETVKFTGKYQEVTIKNSDVPDNIEEIFDILGLPHNNSNGNHLLNYYLSNENYNDNAKLLISYYGNTWDENSLFKTLPTEVSDSPVCMSSGFCMGIWKIDAERIFKMYGFAGNITDYFKTTDLLEDQYVFIVQNTSVPPMFNSPDAIIKHNISDYNFDGDTVTIIDNQVITVMTETLPYELNTYAKKVTYNLKKDETGSYYLSSIDTEEMSVEEVDKVDNYNSISNIDVNELSKFGQLDYNIIKMESNSKYSFSLCVDGKVVVNFDKYISNVSNIKDIKLFDVTNMLYIVTTNGDVYKYNLNNYDLGNYVAEKMSEYSNIDTIMTYKTRQKNAGGCDYIILIDNNGKHYKIDSFCV